MFLIAGVLASLVHLVTHPMATSIGASGAIFGLYGLLLASSIWGMRHRSDVTIPLTAVKTLVPAAAVFILYSLANDSVGARPSSPGFSRVWCTGRSSQEVSAIASRRHGGSPT